MRINPYSEVKANCGGAHVTELATNDLLGEATTRHSRLSVMRLVSPVKPVPHPCSGQRKKATIGAADLLRLQHWKGYTDINFITTFAFPNVHDACCVIEITGTWKNSLLHHRDKVPQHGTRFREARDSYCCSVSFYVCLCPFHVILYILWSVYVATYVHVYVHVLGLAASLSSLTTHFPTHHNVNTPACGVAPSSFCECL